MDITISTIGPPLTSRAPSQISQLSTPITTLSGTGSGSQPTTPTPTETEDTDNTYSCLERTGVLLHVLDVTQQPSPRQPCSML